SAMPEPYDGAGAVDQLPRRALDGWGSPGSEWQNLRNTYGSQLRHDARVMVRWIRGRHRARAVVPAPEADTSCCHRRRVVVVPGEELAARPAAQHRPACPRTSRQTHRPGGVRLRQSVVLGVRDRGDTEGPRPS